MTDLTMERRFDVDADTVYAFLTRPENIIKWWGPEYMTVREIDMDLTRRGPWVVVLENAEGQRFKVSGAVTSLDPPRRVEFTWGWHDEADARGAESRVVYEVSAASPSGARFRLSHLGLPNEEAAKGHDRGWTSNLERIERLLN